MAKELILSTDTNIILYRSKFAYKNLSRRDGHPSGVVYGTIGFVSRLLKRMKPDYFVPVFDYGKSDHRRAIDIDYKGTRGTNASETINQFIAVRMLFEELGFSPYFEKNVEADDLLAKLALFHSKGKELVIVTQDHDMFQLIRDNVRVLRPKMGKRPEQIVTKESFTESNGIEPERIHEVWAITGDAGDNVPGVKGYGHKTALKSIDKHGSLESAIANDPKLTPHAEQILMARDLVKLDGTVATEDPVLQKYEQVIENIYENENVYEFLEQWEMFKFLREYEAKTLFS